jgi:hypothetical protein
MSTTDTASTTEFDLVQAMIIPCDDRCMFAKHEDCDCECGGRNHQKGSMLTEAQRSIVRTPAGRRVRLLAPGTPEFDVALAWHTLEAEEGWTRREIAAEAGVSAPCVRRALRSLEATLEAAAAQAA